MTPPLAAWGLTGAPEPLVGGHRNTVLRVWDHVLKSTRRDAAAIAWLLPVLDAAEASGFRVARPLRSATGAWIVDGWTCEPFLTGVPADVAPITRMMAAFHERAASIPQRPGFASSQDLLAQTCGGDVDLSAMPLPLVVQIRDAWSELASVPLGVIHGDIGTGNVLVDADGRYALIDWDEARRDVLAFDHVALGVTKGSAQRAAMGWEIACCWQIEPERAKALAMDFMA